MGRMGEGTGIGGRMPVTKCETHKLRKRRAGTRLPYVCLECGKEFKIMTGVLVARTTAEEDDYYKRRRELMLAAGVW